MKLVLYIGKTKIVKFTPSNFSYSPWHITFTENLHVETNAIKSLGFQQDSQLSWMPHINYLFHKLSSACYVMRRLSHVLNIQTLRSVYIEHFHSLVNYRIIFWGNTSSVRKVFLTPPKIYYELSWELVQGVFAENVLKIWRFYPFPAGTLTLNIACC
jgi:hypothetical protein